MAKDVAGSLLDRKLLEAAANGATGTEMEEKFGIGAAEALLRVRTLLGDNRSAFDEFEQRQLLIISLKKMKADILASGVDVQNPKHIEAVTKLTLAIDRVAGNQAKMSEDLINQVSDAQARKLLALIEEAWGPVRDWLREEYGAFVDIGAAEKVFADNLRKAAQTA